MLLSQEQTKISKSSDPARLKIKLRRHHSGQDRWWFMVAALSRAVEELGQTTFDDRRNVLGAGGHD
ncbi:hypothetical protein, partial [Streptomyces sp. NPDC007205]|uniref:hypothetical protein n=1 Tax=Streptomyces sp. NPDC007205 TaxID=3154316 RepID=UPI0033D5D22C